MGKTGEIFVFGLFNISSDEIEETVNIISGVIKEFNLLLSVKNGNIYKKNDLKYIIDLVRKCSDKGEIDFDFLEKEIYKLRNNQDILSYGIVILVDDAEYRFKNPEAIYGSGSPEGLIVIRKRYINKPTVRHEFGHMIGLGQHHENCVMCYACNYEEFCSKCKQEIKELWEL